MEYSADVSAAFPLLRPDSHFKIVMRIRVHPWIQVVRTRLSTKENILSLIATRSVYSQTHECSSLIELPHNLQWLARPDGEYRNSSAATVTHRLRLGKAIPATYINELVVNLATYATVVRASEWLQLPARLMSRKRYYGILLYAYIYVCRKYIDAYTKYICAYIYICIYVLLYVTSEYSM